MCAHVCVLRGVSVSVCMCVGEAIVSVYVCRGKECLC